METGQFSLRVAQIFISLVVCATVAFALWVTKEVWVLLALLFLVAVPSGPKSTIKTRCPKCECEFTAEKRKKREDKTEDEEDE